MNILKPKNITPPRIEAEAYLNSWEGISIENALAQTQAAFDTKIAETEREHAGILKNPESEKDITALRREESKNDWERGKAETEGKIPSLTAFLLIAFLGFLGFVAEAVLLQRIADI